MLIRSERDRTLAKLLKRHNFPLSISEVRRGINIFLKVNSNKDTPLTKLTLDYISTDAVNKSEIME